ncbi:hypothetical protein ACFWJT_15795 [Streptomyces sp. NPDC127069]|uniref:hypothetical protein n=1 Tax=Streptomyces sp. NPDC127069 TaxID=3347128 RepID=UPI003658BFA6
MAYELVATYVTKAGMNVVVESKNGTPEARCGGCDQMYLHRDGSLKVVKKWAEQHAPVCNIK